MYQPIYLFIGLRYLWNPYLSIFKKLITLLSIIGISFSIAFLIIIVSIINGFEENFKKNILSFIPHLIITNKNKCVNKSEFPKKILNIYNVKEISELVNQEVIIKYKENISAAEIVGIDQTNYKNIQNYNIKNFFHLTPPKKNNAILGKQLARKLHIHIGDKIKLIFLSNLKNISSYEDIKEYTFKVVELFSTKNEIDYYQIITNKKDALNFLKISKNNITGWRIWLKDPMFLNDFKIKNLNSNLIVLDWKFQKGEIFKAITIEKYIILFFFVLIFVIAILNIFITLTINIIEQRKSIAILQLQGLSNSKIILIFVTLSVITVMIGNILGTIISVFLILQNNLLKYLIKVCFFELNISIIVIPFQVFYINIMSIFVTTLAILYPACSVIKSKPVRILSNE